MWEKLHDLLARTDIISSVASYINYIYAPIIKGAFWKENYFQVVKIFSFRVRFTKYMTNVWKTKR